MARQPRVPPTAGKPRNRPAKPPPLRVSQVVIVLGLIDQFDAPRQTDQIVFVGDNEGTAVAKATAFLTNNLPAMLEAPVEPVTAPPES